MEATLHRHPAIREAAVLPVPDELLGSPLLAVITADGAGDLAREGVLDHCRQWLLESAGDGRTEASSQRPKEGA